MSKYIDINGNTWDGTPLMSKLRHDPKYGAFITLGWLASPSVPFLDLEAHDKEVKKKMFREILLFLRQLKETSYDTAIHDTLPFTDEREKAMDDLKLADWYLDRLEGFYRECFKEESGNA